MIGVEIRTPRFNEESQEIEWHSLAHVWAENHEIKLGGDESVVHWGPVMSPSLGRSVHPSEDPEEWTRSLPHAYRGGDLVAVLLRDDAAPADGVVDTDIAEPDFPEPAPFGEPCAGNR
jgi:hypothetical protein